MYNGNFNHSNNHPINDVSTTYIHIDPYSTLQPTWRN